MDTTVVASMTQGFISNIGTAVGDNIGIVLGFAVAIILWGIFKKYVFGGARRI